MADVNTNLVCFGFNTSFQRQLIDAWTINEKVNRVDLVALSRKSCPQAAQHAQTALRSARHVPRGRYGSHLKLDFLRLQYNWIYRYLAKINPTQVLIYNGLNGVNYLASAACQELGFDRLYFERAPLQDRIQIDAKGVNFQSSIPVESEFYQRLDANEFSGYKGSDYVFQHERILNSRSERRLTPMLLERAQPYVFCPLQVPRDTQVTVFGGWVTGMPHFLNCVNEASHQLPPGVQMRIKEHPKSPVSFSDRIKQFGNSRLILDNDNNTYALIKNSLGVITVNSSVGLEAFLFDKPVITLGRALYSFGELTVRANDMKSLCEMLRNLVSVSWSHIERDRFIKFLHFWLPSLSDVLSRRYTVADLVARDLKFQSLLR